MSVVRMVITFGSLEPCRTNCRCDGPPQVSANVRPNVNQKHRICQQHSTGNHKPAPAPGTKSELEKRRKLRNAFWVELVRSQCGHRAHSSREVCDFRCAFYRICLFPSVRIWFWLSSAAGLQAARSLSCVVDVVAWQDSVREAALFGTSLIRS